MTRDLNCGATVLLSMPRAGGFAVAAGFGACTVRFDKDERRECADNGQMENVSTMLTRRTLVRMMAATAVLPATVEGFAAVKKTRLLIGTGTGGKSKSKGIYVADFDATTGSLGEMTLAAELESPTWIAVDRHQQHLFAISEVKKGMVTSFAVNKGSGVTLTKVNEQSAEGSGPAHVGVNRDGKSVYVANYGSGSLTSYAVDKAGTISPSISHFQYKPVDGLPEHAHPHAHEATPSPDGKFLLVNDLGSDRIMIYRIDQKTGKLTENTPAFWQGRQKSGPRHLTFHPNGKWVYNVNELDSTVDHLAWDKHTGTLTTIGSFVSTLEPDFPKNTAFCSEILTSKDGRFCYVGNRRNETVAMLSIDHKTGAVKLEQVIEHGGKTARHVTLDPTEKFLLVACQDSAQVSVMARDAVTGKLSGPVKLFPIDSPQCLVFVS
ncbi:6-phosphogluconolactonase [Granulicella pectinivorans]|uniref:6-phosphogluconolactonase n=1 Tax=Granulicella pectinivorans TaxID=474950 RepID=A0A1I6M3Z8_9BACT|nr:lactonase family protein [Granulicella pectinivorans]SFS10394.1 6-phosphogluconolactonase [Granulicella pectinivorans]